MKTKLFLTALIVTLAVGFVYADIIARSGNEWVRSTTIVRRNDLVDEKQKLREDKQTIKDACDIKVAAVQVQIDAVQAEINKIDTWVDPAVYNP